jgi:hypothetical protein
VEEDRPLPGDGQDRTGAEDTSPGCRQVHSLVGLDLSPRRRDLQGLASVPGPQVW